VEKHIAELGDDAERKQLWNEKLEKAKKLLEYVKNADVEIRFEKSADTAEVICSWCGKKIGEKESIDNKPSHGMCSECRALPYDKMDEMARKRKQEQQLKKQSIQEPMWSPFEPVDNENVAQDMFGKPYAQLTPEQQAEVATKVPVEKKADNQWFLPAETEVDIREWFEKAFGKKPEDNPSYFKEWQGRWGSNPRAYMDLERQKLFDELKNSKKNLLEREAEKDKNVYYSVWDNQCDTWMHTGGNSKTKEQAIEEAFEYAISDRGDDNDETDYTSFTIEDKENELDAIGLEIKRHIGLIDEDAMGLEGEDEFTGKAKEVPLLEQEEGTLLEREGGHNGGCDCIACRLGLSKKADASEGISGTLSELGVGDKFVFIADPEKIYILLDKNEEGFVLQDATDPKGKQVIVDVGSGTKQIIWWGEAKTKKQEPAQKPEEAKEKPVNTAMDMGDLKMGDSFVVKGGKEIKTIVGVYPKYDFVLWMDNAHNPKVSEISVVKDVAVEQVGAYPLERIKELEKKFKPFLDEMIGLKEGEKVGAK
jgi:hypothetical protein